MADRRMLGDRYEVEDELGRGGMATVYRGRDRVLGRDVAIKVLSAGYAADQRFVTRFRREARAAAGLSHANVVSVYDTGQANGSHYIVMELLDGETLGDLLRREGSLTPERAARITAQIADALQAAHDRGLVHRDVKPANVMLGAADEVKVMDFGIARAATDDTLTAAGTVLGTASYLSPEQSRGDPVDHRSDIYSLGCVLYEMLTGRPPFAGEGAVSVAYRHVHEVPASPSAVNRSIPPALDDVVMRALHKDPEGRFPSATALREALEPAGAGGQTEPLPAQAAEPTEALTPTGSPARRAWGWLIGTGAVLLLLIAALAFWPEERADRRQPGRDRASTPAAEPPPSPAEADVAEALVATTELVQVAIATGELEPEAGARILEEVEKAVEAYDAQKLEDAVKHLGAADVSIDAALIDGNVTSAEVAETLHQGIAAIRAAMSLSATPPPETPTPDEDEADGEDGGDAGPGNSENAPGQIKKDQEED